MLLSKNPYSPGAGRTPAALVGRDLQLETWDAQMERLSMGMDARPIALYGLRGIGKTVLLSKMHEMAAERNWISARIEADVSSGLRESVSDEFDARLAELIAPNPGEKLLKALKTALSFKASVGIPGGFSFGLDLGGVVGTNANSGDMSTDLGNYIKSIAALGEEMNTGAALLIDEAQELSPDDLAAISRTAHRATQEGWRFVVAIAGLPTLPALLAKAKSYAERMYDYHMLKPLNTLEAEEALTEPAKLRNVQWDKAAAKKVVKLSGGYPYFLQEYGSICWLEAKESPINTSCVSKAVRRVEERLDTGFFLSRWDRATDSQKDYLRAMAADQDGISRSRDIADRLETDVTQLSQRRAELIKKGLIYPYKKGYVAFTVPLMKEFINRQTEKE
jgi:hypothetical protein